MKKITLLIILNSVFFFACKKDDNKDNSNNSCNCKTKTDPIAYYPFTNNANDLSGNGHHGSINGGVTLTSDRKGNTNSAYLFNGTDGNILINNLNIDKCNFTISAWIKPSSFNSFSNSKATHDEYSGIFCKLNSDINNQSGITTSVNGKIARIQAKLTDNNFTDISYKNSNVAITNSWQHIVYTIENGFAKIYLDNKLIASGGNTNSNVTVLYDNQPAYIGKTIWFPSKDLLTSYFSGAMDEVRIYNRAISSPEVNTLFNQ